MGVIVCFGEVLLRLTAANRGLLKTASGFDVAVGGAEANVAAALANLGHRARLATTVSCNSLGQHALRELRASGVDCEAVETGPGRMGLYFLSPGAGSRPSEIVYDRSQSAFAAAEADSYDWRGLLAGVTHLHLSGINLALGEGPSKAALAAFIAARSAGVVTSFDCNFRPKLWEASRADPRAAILPLVEHADILFGDHRDISMILGRTLEGKNQADRRNASSEAFAAFPTLELIASTARRVEDADRHWLAARLDTRTDALETAEVPVFGIIDRIGGGDAFAAGVLHQTILTPGALSKIASTGLALATLKHSIVGDFCELAQEDIDAWIEGTQDVRR